MILNDTITAHEGHMFGAAYAITHDRQIAHEAVQEAARGVLLTRPTLYPGSTRSYLCACSANAAKRLMRTSREIPVSNVIRSPGVSDADHLDALRDRSAPDHDPAARLDATESAQAKIAAFRTLPDRYKRVLFLQATGCSIEEIAAHLGLSTHTANNYIYRGRRRLRAATRP